MGNLGEQTEEQTEQLHLQQKWGIFNVVMVAHQEGRYRGYAPP